MVANKAAVLAATAVLVEAALGFNAHGHHHAHIDKRALETDWVTEWVTVWVTPGQELAAAPTTTAQAAKKKNKNKTKSAVYNVPTTTSTTVVVVPTSAAEAEGAYSQPKTTLTTAVKPKSEVVVAPQYTTTTQEAVAEVPEATSEEAVAAVSSTEEAVAAVPTTSEAVYVEQATTTKAAAASTTSKKAKATSSSSSGSSAGLSSKRGLAYNSGALANTFGSNCDNCGWGYNWDSTSDDLDSTYDFIPQLWSDLAIHTDRWETNLATCFEATNKPKAIFSFNEPDMANQAAMTPALAAEKHVKFLNPHADKALIGAPSVSNSGTDGEGLSWLSSWIDECDKLTDEKCHYDFCNIHWYSQPEYSDTLFTQLEKAHDLCGKPIWLTEFAPLSTDATAISSFLEEVIPKLEALDYVHAYAYWMISTSALMSSESTLSSYGQTYASL